MASKIIVIGASAGGVEALRELVHYLPARLPAAIFIVLHMSPYHDSQLPKILSTVGKFRAFHAKDGQQIQPECIYVAPPNLHMILSRGHVHVRFGPRDNRHRPSIDQLFHSAAKSYGSKTIGIMLTGTMDDGVNGCLAIQQAGGTVIVQNPDEAHYPMLPKNVINRMRPDFVLRLAEIPPLLMTLTERSIESGATKGKVIAQMKRLTKRPDEERIFSCPQCHGVLKETQNGGITEFRCLVGHRYSLEGMEDDQAEALERALWTAVRSLEERAQLNKRLSKEARQRNNSFATAHFEKRFNDLERDAVLIQSIIKKRKDP